jgi:hypothetical protein
MDVFTTKGILDRSQLTVKDIVTEEDSVRVIATEWYLGDEMVRRDVNVNILCGQSLGAEQGSV